MANTHNARGLKPLRGSNGGEPRMRKYLANVTTDIFQGDVVQLLAAGTVKTITTTTGNSFVLGVAANAIDASDYTTNQELWVFDDPDQEYEITDDGAAATLSAADVGATFAMILTTGNTITGISKQEIDASASGAATTDPLILQGFKTGPNLTIGKYASEIVKLNRHIWKTGSAGV